MKMPKLICHYKCRSCGKTEKDIIDDAEELAKGVYMEEDELLMDPTKIVDPFAVMSHECSFGGIGICDIIRYEYDSGEEDEIPEENQE